MEGFQFKVRIKYQVEKYISTENNILETFYDKWPKDLSPLELSSCVIKIKNLLLCIWFLVLFFFLLK